MKKNNMQKLKTIWSRVSEVLDFIFELIFIAVAIQWIIAFWSHDLEQIIVLGIVLIFYKVVEIHSDLKNFKIKQELDLTLESDTVLNLITEFLNKNSNYELRKKDE